MKKANKENRPSHVTTGNVLDDLGLSPEEKAPLKLKMDLHADILKIIQKNLPPQPRVS